MEAGLMEIVLSVNRSWIDDAYFSLYRYIHPGGKVRGECPGGNVRIPLRRYYHEKKSSGHSLRTLVHNFVLPEKDDRNFVSRSI